METWRRYAAECEDLMRQHDAATTDGARLVLLKMAARKFDLAFALCKATKGS